MEVCLQTTRSVRNIKLLWKWDGKKVFTLSTWTAVKVTLAARPKQSPAYPLGSQKHHALEQREAGICRKASTATETESSLGKDNSSPLLRGLLGTEKPNESVRAEWKHAKRRRRNAGVSLCHTAHSCSPKQRVRKTERRSECLGAYEVRRRIRCGQDTVIWVQAHNTRTHKRPSWIHPPTHIHRPSYTITHWHSWSVIFKQGWVFWDTTLNWLSARKQKAHFQWKPCWVMTNFPEQVNNWLRSLCW